MKFGVCCQLAEAPEILDAGFDYVELGASGFNGLEPHWDPSPYRGLPILATNLFFDSRIKLFGPDQTAYREYAERTVRRAAQLRVPVMVMGSGASRSAPEGFHGDTGFLNLVAEIAEYAAPLGITIAPESLNRSESNVGNNLRSLAIGLRLRGVGYTADSYHILYEWDADGRQVDVEQIIENQIPFPPTHVHVADLPRQGVDASDPMLQAFAARLKKLAYAGNVSLECSRPPGFDLENALKNLAALFDI